MLVEWSKGRPAKDGESTPSCEWIAFPGSFAARSAAQGWRLASSTASVLLNAAPAQFGVASASVPALASPERARAGGPGPGG